MCLHVVVLVGVLLSAAGVLLPLYSGYAVFIAPFTVFKRHRRFPEKTRDGFSPQDFPLVEKIWSVWKGRFGRVSLVSLCLVLISLPLTEYRAKRPRCPPACLMSFHN